MIPEVNSYVKRKMDLSRSASSCANHSLRVSEGLHFSARSENILMVGEYASRYGVDTVSRN
jgi:hypothetical protein